jgi:uncharacterized nucleotidyltransferase DUF6036
LIHLHVLSSVDLAVTKISRYSPQDREDILALASAGLFSADQLRNRATEALLDYIGDRAPVMTSIELICRQISAEKLIQLDREPEFPIDPSTMSKGKEPELEV